MSTLNVTIADAIEEAINVTVDPDILHFEYLGRYFRCVVHDDYDKLQICNNDFDRWANSVGATVSPCPVFQGDMKRAIEFLRLIHVGQKYCGTATPIIAAINEHLQKST